MRQFTEFEKKIMRRLVDIWSEDDYISKLTPLQLIVECLDYRVIKYIGKNVVFVSSAISSGIGSRMYFELGDFFSLIDDLERLNCIRLRTSHNLSDNKEFINDVYFSHLETDEDLRKAIKENLDSDMYAIMEVDPTFDLYMHLFNKYSPRMIVYPTSTLLELVNNDFKDAEHRRFEEQLEDERKRHTEQLEDATKKHDQQMNLAHLTLVAALVAPNLGRIWCVVISVIKFIKELICN